MHELGNVVDLTVDRRQRRAVRPDVAQNRLVLELFASLSDKLGPWQQQGVRLAALIARSRATGRVEPRFAAEAAALIGAIDIERDKFETLLRQHPHLIDHGRVTDLRRALDSLSESFARASGRH